MREQVSSRTRPSCLARHALDQRGSELLDAESHRAAEIDVREVRRADAALYQAKQQGRNRVVVA